MDLGIKDRWAIVCASSRGLGRGCAMALAREGVNIVVNGVNEERLTKTAEEIRAAASVEVIAVAADVATIEGRTKLLAACPNPDILINNAGGPPAGNFRDFTHEQWLAALEANMLAPIELIKATIDGMITRRFGRIVNITSGSVKAPIASLGMSNGARSGLTGYCAGVAREVSRYNVTINNILPGSFDTDRLRGGASRHLPAGKTVDDIMNERRVEEASGRFGNPEEFGMTCAFLCGANAGYITRQNILLDGGTYPGTF